MTCYSIRATSRRPVDQRIEIEEYDYEVLTKNLRISSSNNGNGPTEGLRPTREEIDAVVKKILFLSQTLTPNEIIHFLKQAVNKANTSRIPHLIVFCIEEEGVTVFSRFEGGFSGVYMSKEGAKLLPPTLNGEPDPDAKNFFSTLILGGRRVEEIKPVGSHRESDFFDPNVVLDKNLTYLRRILRKGTIGPSTVSLLPGVPSDDDIFDLLRVLYDHSKKKNSKRIVNFLISLADLAQKNSAPLVFSVKEIDSPPKRIFFSIQTGDMIHNALVRQGRTQSFHPIKQGSTEPDFSKEGLFFPHKLP